MPADHSALKVLRTLWALKVPKTLWVPVVSTDLTAPWMPADLTDLKAPHPQWVLVDPRHLRVSKVFADLWDPREFRNLSPEISTVLEDSSVDSNPNVVVVTAWKPDNPTDLQLVTAVVPQETLSMAPDTALPADPSHTDQAVNPVDTRAPAHPHTQTVTDTLADMEAPGEQYAHLALSLRATNLVRKTKMAQ